MAKNKQKPSDTETELWTRGTADTENTPADGLPGASEPAAFPPNSAPAPSEETKAEKVSDEETFGQNETPGGATPKSRLDTRLKRCFLCRHPKAGKKAEKETLPEAAEECGEPVLPSPPVPKVVIASFDKKDYRTLSVLLGMGRAGRDLPALTQRDWAALHEAVDQGDLTYLLAFNGPQAVGCCSVRLLFSPRRCAVIGLLDDFTLLPDAPAETAARLAESALGLALGQGAETLCVCRSTEERPLYAALGFSEPVGTIWALPVSKSKTICETSAGFAAASTT